MSVHNRGTEAARLHAPPDPVVPEHLVVGRRGAEADPPRGDGEILASHPELGDYTLSCGGAPELLFTENETNAQRLWGQPNPTPYVKDAFHRYVIGRRA